MRQHGSARRSPRCPVPTTPLPYSNNSASTAARSHPTAPLTVTAAWQGRGRTSTLLIRQKLDHHTSLQGRQPRPRKATEFDDRAGDVAALDAGNSTVPRHPANADESSGTPQGPGRVQKSVSFTAAAATRTSTARPVPAASPDFLRAALPPLSGPRCGHSASGSPCCAEAPRARVPSPSRHREPDQRDAPREVPSHDRSPRRFCSHNTAPPNESSPADKASDRERVERS